MKPYFIALFAVLFVVSMVFAGYNCNIFLIPSMSNDAIYHSYITDVYSNKIADTCKIDGEVNNFNLHWRVVSWLGKLTGLSNCFLLSFFMSFLTFIALPITLYLLYKRANFDANECLFYFIVVALYTLVNAFIGGSWSRLVFYFLFLIICIVIFENENKPRKLHLPLMLGLLALTFFIHRAGFLLAFVVVAYYIARKAKLNFVYLLPFVAVVAFFFKDYIYYIAVLNNQLLTVKLSIISLIGLFFCFFGLLGTVLKAKFNNFYGELFMILFTASMLIGYFDLAVWFAIPLAVSVLRGLDRKYLVGALLAFTLINVMAINFEQAMYFTKNGVTPFLGMPAGNYTLRAIPHLTNFEAEYPTVICRALSVTLQSNITMELELEYNPFYCKTLGLMGTYCLTPSP